MKKLLIGLTLLASMSSFASTRCDVSLLSIFTDNQLNQDEINNIKSKLTDKGYNVMNLDTQNYDNFRRSFDLTLSDSSLVAGIVISMGIERDIGHISSYNPVVDTYRRMTPKATRMTEVSHCSNIVKQSESAIYGSICNKSTVLVSRTTLDDFTSESLEHDKEVVAWSLNNIKNCE